MVYGTVDCIVAGSSGLWLKSLANAHRSVLLGSSLQLICLAFIVIYPSANWPRADTPDGRGSSAQWGIILALSVVQGRCRSNFGFVSLLLHINVR